MSSASSVTEVERAEYLTYEGQRRRRILSIAAPAGVTLTSIACLAATVTLVLNPGQDTTVRVNDILTFFLAVVFGLSWLALRRGRLTLATALVEGAAGGGILVTVAIAC